MPAVAGAKECDAIGLSLVITSRNRASQLSRSLESLLGLQAPVPWELIVVDNGSTDTTQAVIAKFKDRLSTPFVSILEPRPGSGVARNTGWRAARGEIVAFTDDDCYPAEDYLTAIVQCFKENERLGFLGGRILLYDQTDYPITIQESTTRHDFPPHQFIAAGLIQGASFACRRSALEATGGFDDRFGAGTPFPCEDIDLVARMSARGWHGAYDPRPLIYHHHGRKTHADAARLMKQYDYGRGAYYVKSLLDPRMRATYGKVWLSLILHQSPRKTLREITSGLKFLIRNASSHASNTRH